MKPAYIHNLDLRYEWYPASGESVSVGFVLQAFPASDRMDFPGLVAEVIPILLKMPIRPGIMVWR